MFVSRTSWGNGTGRSDYSSEGVPQDPPDEGSPQASQNGMGQRLGSLDLDRLEIVPHLSFRNDWAKLSCDTVAGPAVLKACPPGQEPWQGLGAVSRRLLPARRSPVAVAASPGPARRPGFPA